MRRSRMVATAACPRTRAVSPLIVSATTSIIAKVSR